MKKNQNMIKSMICLLWSLLFATPLILSQEFASPQINPFSLTDEGIRTSPAFADIDLDNDLDLFTGLVSGDFGFYENNGASNVPSFGDLWLGPFNISSIGGNATPFMVDIDNDGDFDLLAGGSNSGIWYYENVGTANVASFTFPIANPFSLIGPTGITKPYMVDIDNDVDLDLFMGSTDGNIYFYENINTGIARICQESEPGPNAVNFEQRGGFRRRRKALTSRKQRQGKGFSEMGLGRLEPETTKAFPRKRPGPLPTAAYQAVTTQAKSRLETVYITGRTHNLPYLPPNHAGICRDLSTH